MMGLLAVGTCVAIAADITVMSSGAFYASMEALAPTFEKQTGHKVTLVSGSSMGSSPTAIPARLKAGETADLVMMAGSELDRMIQQGHVVPGSRVDLVHSKIGMVVKAGSPKPDISNQARFEMALGNAKSIGYSASASGVHMSKEVLPRIEANGVVGLVAKSREIVKDRVATWVARGDVEVGFQQVSELLPIPGVDFAGEIPAPYQKVTVFSVGLAAATQQPEVARQLVDFLKSPSLYPALKKQGLEPATLAERGLGAALQ
jgi:molybdate transport system substrate-binding protein